MIRITTSSSISVKPLWSPWTRLVSLLISAPFEPAVPQRRGAGAKPAPPTNRGKAGGLYQLLPSQPPLVAPPVVSHVRSLVPLASLTMLNVLPLLDSAVTV